MSEMTEVELSIKHAVFISTPGGIIRLKKEGNRLIASLFNMADVEVSILQPLTITTPVGILKIETMNNDRRKASLRFPSSWAVHKEGKEERVLTDFFIEDENGVKPNFLLLSPMTNADGYLVGFNPIQRENLQLRLVEDKEEENAVPPSQVNEEELING